MGESVVVAVVASGLIAANAPADEPKAGNNKLVGTWKLISGKYDGQDSDLATRMLCIKHVTPTHWMWAYIDPATKQVMMTAGGTYTIKDDTYVEVPLYAMGQGLEGLLEKPQKFTFKVEGDKWQHSGELSTGRKLEEVWEKQPGAAAEK